MPLTSCGLTSIFLPTLVLICIIDGTSLKRKKGNGTSLNLPYIKLKEVNINALQTN
jgi:hypothetical protein